MTPAPAESNSKHRNGAHKKESALVTRPVTVGGVVQPYARRLLLATVAGAAGELCAVALIASAAWLIARAAQQPPLSALALAIVAVRAFALFRGVLRYTERLLGHDAALRVLAALRARVYEALRRPRTPLRDAEAVERMVADVEAVQDLLLRCLLPAVIAGVTGVAAIGLTTALLPAAGVLLAVGILLGGVALPALAAALARGTARRTATARADLSVRALDVTRGADDLAVFGATDRFVARATDAAARLARLERRSGAAESLVTGLGIAVQGLTAVAIIRVAADRGGVLPAVLALTALIAVEAVLPLAEAARRRVEIAPAVHRVNDLLATTPDGPRRTPQAPVRDATRPIGVELVRVRLTYGESAALDGVDLRIPAGRKVAIVGASGAGKSSLLGVLSGELTPDSGIVLLGDAPPDTDDLRNAVRGLTQDAHIFDTTIRANLARPYAPKEKLAEAARQADLLDWIESVGWETPATTLSGGQRQRLLIARALLADPPILILDEPAEGLDTPAADRLVTNLLTGPQTVVLVTHRLAPLDQADEILVMDQGRIVQRGTPAQLADAPGPYRALWETELLASSPGRAGP